MKSEFDKIHETLDRINRNIPSSGFIMFWLGFVPIFGFLIGVIIYGS